ncbi:MAG: efflux RND transporter permease subunit, partial [Candidatus Pacebacteria bacterium]|nr:efflux RND transporter permease subunit [Candidatus Paceibacterota bacterium]
MFPFWHFFLKKQQFSIFLIMVLVLFGTYTVFVIPKESSPEVEIPMGIVTTVLPGASSSDVEQLVTNKLEDEIDTIENIDTLTSYSQEGVSTVTAQFLASADLDKSIQDLKDAVDRAKTKLPEEAKEPVVTRINFADQPILIASVTLDAPPSEITKLSKQIEDELRSVKGVSKVITSGVRDRETNVIVRKEALADYGLRLTDVIQALQANNASLPIGSVTIDGVDYAVKFHGDITDPAQVADIPVGYKGGQTVYVRDIAFVSDGLEKEKTISRVSVKGIPGQQAIGIYAYKTSGGDVTEITQNLRQKLADLQTTIIKNAEVVVTFDHGELVTKDLTELTRVGIETVVLVMLSLLLTIGWRESIVAGLSIPLSFLIAFIGLWASGNTINFISLFSLILAIGILVDSGIVVTEAIHTRFKIYGNAYDAAVASLKEYAWPLIAGTTATIAVFVPLFFISGITGKFIASIPFTIIFVLVASIFVALGIVPLIAILFTKGEQNRFEKKQEEYTLKVQTWYRENLRRLLLNRKFQNRFLSIIFGAFFIALTLPGLGFVKVIFFPGGNNDFIYIDIEKPQGTTLAQTDLSVRAVEEILYERTDVDSFVTTIGEASQFNESSQGANTKLANITLNLKKEREKTSSQIKQEVKEALAPIHDVQIRVLEPSSGPPSGAPISIKLIGDNLNDVERGVAHTEQALRSISGVTDITTSTKDDGSQFVLTVDKSRAAELGLNPSIVASVLRTAVNGTVATTIHNNDKDIDVVVKTNLNTKYATPDETNWANMDSIRQLTIQGVNGPILLGSVLSESLEKSNALIRHEDKERYATVSSYIKPGITAGEIKKEFDTMRDSLNIPDGVRLVFGGENEDVDKSFTDMLLALVAGLALMFAILVLEFNSFRYTTYLLMVVPLSLVGVFAGLAITGEPLSFPSMLGFIALAGVIINHAIILMDS